MSHSYAGLWTRIKAFAADYLVISAYIVLLIAISLLLQSIDPEILQPLFSNAYIAQLSGFLLITLPVTLYFAVSEASSQRATWGKRWQGISVIQNNGEKLTRLQSLGRTALKFIPWELSHTLIWQINFGNMESESVILIGFILVWVWMGLYVFSIWQSPTGQSIYDTLTGTFVIQS